VEDVFITKGVKLLLRCVVVVPTGEEGSGFGCQEVILNNELCSVPTLPIGPLNDGEKHDEELIKEAKLSAELGRKQVEGRIVGKGEGKIQLLDGFGPLNTGLSP
jgi:hypothetical protein